MCVSREHIHARIGFRELVSSISFRKKNTRGKGNPLAFLKAVGKETHLVTICQKKTHTYKMLLVVFFVGGGVLFFFFIGRFGGDLFVWGFF